MQLFPNLVNRAFQNRFSVCFLVFHISTVTFSRSLALLASCWGHRPGWELGQALPTSSRRPCGPIGLARTSQRSVLRLLYLLHMPRDIPTRKHADNLLETASLLFVIVCFFIYFYIFIPSNESVVSKLRAGEMRGHTSRQTGSRRTLPADHHTGTGPFHLFGCRGSNVLLLQARSLFQRSALCVFREEAQSRSVLGHTTTASDWPATV